MAIDSFDLDDNLIDSKYKEELEHADILCVREKYNEALDIYNKILEEDYKCLDAYIGILKAHSLYFTKFDGEEIEKDIRVINRMFPNNTNNEFVSYIQKRENNYKQDDSIYEFNKKEIPPYRRDLSTIYFGSYFDDDESDNKSEIEWKIIDEKDGKALIITNKIIDSKIFDSKSNNYENSEIRKWLNNEFLNIAFNEKEISIILDTAVDNSLQSIDSDKDYENEYICNNTTDKLFLLSVDEVNTYENDFFIRAKGTYYAIGNGLKRYSNEYTDDYSYWWLRSPYERISHYVYVADEFFDFSDGHRDVTKEGIGIRPACWIKL